MENPALSFHNVVEIPFYVETSAGLSGTEDKEEEIARLKVELEESEAGRVQKTEELARMKRTLAEEVLCPVCLSVPRSSRIPCCRYGHITCLPCWRPQCPTCRQPMKPEMFSTLALKISELLEIECINKEKGCKMSLLKNQLLQHEVECRFTENIDCPGINCSVRVSLATVVDHVVSCPGVKVMAAGALFHIPTLLNIKLTNNLIVGNLTLLYNIHYCEDKVFLVARRINEETVFFMKLFSEDRKKKYTVMMEVSNLDNTVARSFVGETVHLTEKDDQALEEGNAINISDKVLRKTATLVMENNNFLLHVKFTLKRKFGTADESDAREELEPNFGNSLQMDHQYGMNIFKIQRTDQIRIS